MEQADFSFHGFGDRQAEAERKLAAAGLRVDEPGVQVAEGAVFSPAVNVWTPDRAASDLSFAGGIVAADGEPIDAAQLQRGRRKIRGGLDEPVSLAPAREIDEDAVYLGWMFDHFGRFLLDSLARIWFLRQADPSLRVVFHLPPPSKGLFLDWEPRIPGWASRILDAFGVPPSRILVPDVSVRFRRLLVPEAAFVQGFAAYERMVQPFQDVASRLAAGVQPSSQPVYLSRRLLSSRRRPIVGEGVFEDVLRENGFLVVHPETMTFENQVRLVNAHADIFSNVGSAAHNILFALQSPRLHLFANGDRIPRNFHLCSALAHAPTAFVNGLDTRQRPTFDGSQSTPLVVDPSNLIDYLHEQGFLRSRVRATIALADPTLDDAYDEAWLYARARSAIMNAEALPAEVAADVDRRAARSWPVSAMLALYHAQIAGDPDRARALLTQFATLAAGAFDMNRFVHYRTEIEIIVTAIDAAIGVGADVSLNDVLARRFALTDLAAQRRRRGMGRPADGEDGDGIM
ncbi:MAG TPA: glycosyltransferase 61 family protein [Thermomicrobiales bacterium]|nr:glycosyltransferase 61 family protein [Thermomicrobiales bacterium]